MIHPDVIKKYAQAWYNLFSTELTVESIYNMSRAAEFLESSKHMLFLLNYAVQEPEQVDQCIQLLCAEFTLPQSLPALIVLLLKHDRIELLIKVIEDIVALYKLDHSIIDVHITTAHQATSQEIDMMTQFFEKQSGMKAFVTYEQDTRLIAGARIDSEFWVWEASVQKQLRMLKQNMLFL